MSQAQSSASRRHPDPSFAVAGHHPGIERRTLERPQSSNLRQPAAHIPLDAAPKGAHEENPRAFFKDHCDTTPDLRFVRVPPIVLRSVPDFEQHFVPSQQNPSVAADANSCYRLVVVELHIHISDPLGRDNLESLCGSHKHVPESVLRQVIHDPFDSIDSSEVSAFNDKQAFSEGNPDSSFAVCGQSDNRLVVKL